MTEDNPDQTTSASVRWPYTNDVLAAYVVVLTSVFVFNRVSVPLFWKTATLLAAIWLFGPKTVAALNKLRGKG